jgi:anthranilate synthase component 1
VFGNDIQVETNGERVEQLQSDYPFAFVTQYQQRFQVAELENLPMFNGGLVGYFAYDCVRYVEPKLKQWPIIQMDMVGITTRATISPRR